VLAVDGVAIKREEVDAHVDALLDIKPAFNLIHRRRLIVMNWAFPLAFGRARAGAARERARARAESRMAARELGPSAPAPSASGIVEGNRDGLGLDLWLVARRLEAGQNSGIVELPGRFALVELIDRDHRRNPALENFSLRLESFNYVDDPRTLVTDCMEAKLEIVDPLWREIVPGIYKYKMRGGLE